MSMSANEANEGLLPTRATLLERVRDPGDQASWREFHDLYRPLVVAVARRGGLTEDEAEDVAQETFRAMVAALPDYRYDPERASFKGWLRTIVNHRIADFVRQRDGRTGARARAMVRERPSTRVLEGVAAPAPTPAEDVFDEEWRRTLLLRALAELKPSVAFTTYQAVYLLIHGKSAADAARDLGISRGSVYLAKHRTQAKLRRRVKELEAKCD
jgi:RNA polymerase sigma-70 factor (ECF subfamily)